MKPIVALSISFVLLSLLPSGALASDNASRRTISTLRPLISDELKISSATSQNLTADSSDATIPFENRLKAHFNCILDHMTEMNTDLAIINMRLQKLDILKNPLKQPYLERNEKTNKELATIYESILNVDSLFYYENRKVDIIDHVRYISKNIKPYINQIFDYKERTQVLASAVFDISILLSKWEEYQTRMRSFQDGIHLLEKNLFHNTSALQRKYLKRKTNPYKLGEISPSLWSQQERLKEKAQRATLTKSIHQKRRFIQHVFNHKQLNQSRTSFIKILHTMPLIKYKNCLLACYMQRFDELPQSMNSALSEHIMRNYDLTHIQP